MSKTICIVDGYSTGAELAPLFRKEGWRCVHIQSNPVIPRDYLLSWRPETFDKHLILKEALIAYMQKALTLLCIKNGPSHSELMMTARGPVLIETAARMQGTIMHSAVVAALGYSHVTLTAERYLDPQRFAARLRHHYRVRQSLYCVTLASEVEGVVRKNRCQELLAQLPSFYGVMHTPDVGEKIYRTTDLFTNPGIIYLCHESQQQIEEDYAQIRAYEKNGALFELA